MPLPTGPAVTFLFTDIEGSTRLERAVGSSAWAEAVARHDELLRQAVQAHGGEVVKTEGDAVFAAFDRPVDAIGAVVDAQRALTAASWPAGGEIRVRMGLHLGEGRLRGGRAETDAEDYVGIDVNYAARIAAAGNGGQIVLSQALVDAIGGDAAALDGGGVELADEGLRAVKDFDEPLRLHRLVVAGAADDARPLRTLTSPSNLPADVTELIGRDAELERLRDELDETRILTLTGPGGSGKTRLALGLGRAVLERFPHGVWFVDLAALRQAHLVETTIAATLAVRESPEKSIGDMLREHLRERTILLLLDNLEQLLPPIAETVATLVRVAPRLCVLVTSRELLRIAGERGYAVPPLDIAAGMELFENRARALRPDLVFTDDSRIAVRTICERLGGVPLAIELAAARVRLMSPALILERLVGSLDLAGSARDVPERQRTLRGAIAWSHDLLSEPEQRLFRRLGVFAGGWTAEEALRVADPGDLGIDVIEGLDSLADKSLIRIEPAEAGGAGETRFDFHPLLREYAQERLTESGERDACEERYAATFVDVLESIGSLILGPRGTDAIRRLDVEIYNLREACNWGITHDRPDVPLRIIAATWRWFQQRGFLREALATIRPQLEKGGVDPRVRIGGLAAVGSLAYWLNDVEAASGAYSERLALAEATDDPVLQAEAHYDIGFLSMVAQDPKGLLDHEQRALALYEGAGDDNGAMRARQALGLATFLVGDYAGAREVETRNQEEFRQKGSPYQVADSQTFLSAVAYRLGEPDAAWQPLLMALSFFAEHDNASGVVRALGMAAILQLDYGDPELGARITGATYELVKQKGVMVAPVTVLHLRDPREIAVERLGQDRGAALMDDGAMTPLPQIIEAVVAAPTPGASMATAAAT